MDEPVGAAILKSPNGTLEWMNGLLGNPTQTSTVGRSPISTNHNSN